MKRKIDLRKANTAEKYGLLSSSIGPRPIAFASTVDGEGKVNLSPYSFFNVFGANPPTLVFAPVRSARTMQDKDTLLNVKEVPEVCINVVTYSMVEQMSLASTSYEKGVNEFEKAGFTEAQSELIKAPRVKESPISFECKVNQIIETGKEGGAGHLVICEVLMAHVDDAFMESEFIADAKKLDLVSRMGKDWYCRASKDALFEVEKPVRKKGIGVDSLPEKVRKSKILSGNDLGKLGNLERMPTQEEVAAYPDEHTEEEKHLLASRWISEGRAMDALALLLR